jgi:hypothetical protein
MFKEGGNPTQAVSKIEINDLLKKDVTKAMEHSLKRSSDNIRLLWSSEFHYRVLNSPPPDHILSEMYIG